MVQDMKDALRKIFKPLLDIFESGDDPYKVQPSHRKILIVVSILFSGLALLVLFLAQGEDPGYLFPVLIFGGVGFTGLVVGTLGNDRAVAKIWGSSK